MAGGGGRSTAAGEGFGWIREAEEDEGGIEFAEEGIGSDAEG